MPGHQQALILSLGAGPRSFQLTSSNYFLAGGGAGQKSGIFKRGPWLPRTHFRKIPENFFCSWSTLKTAAPLAIAAVRYLGAIAGPSWSQKAMRGATARDQGS